MNRFSCHVLLLAMSTLTSFKILHTDTIRVYNMTADNVYIRPYYQEKADRPGQSAGSVALVSARNSIEMIRPKRKWLPFTGLFKALHAYDRMLYVARTKDDLLDTMSGYQLKNFAAITLAEIAGDAFYIDLDRKKKFLKIYTKAEWTLANTVSDIIDQAQSAVDHYTMDQLKGYITSTYIAATGNPHNNETATVRIGNELCAQEAEYLASRTLVTTQTFEKLLGKRLSGKVPKIACVFSGGGYRAMVGTLGSLIGLRDIGLLDGITWTVGLSGSTWALGSWLVSGLGLQDFCDTFFGALDTDITKTTHQEFKNIVDVFAVKWAFNQPITLVDMYGGLLANRLFSYKGEKQQAVYFSAQGEKLRSGTLPLPIFTAIETGRGNTTPRWYEFSPYEVGSAELGCYVPTWAFGRQFYQGKSTDFAPEQTLGFFLGTFGSAFSASYETLYQELMRTADDGISKQIIKAIIQALQKTVGSEELAFAGSARIQSSWAQLHNPVVGLKEVINFNREFIQLTDAGIAFNLPYPPISGQRSSRKADIILFFDYSSEIEILSALHGIEAYARSNVMPFPTIKYEGVNTRLLTVFNDEHDLSVPLVLYMPLVRDEKLWQALKDNKQFQSYRAQLDSFDPVQCSKKSFCSTTNFQYSRRQAEQLAAYTAFAVKANGDAILEQIRSWIEQRINDA